MSKFARNPVFEQEMFDNEKMAFSSYTLIKKILLKYEDMSRKTVWVEKALLWSFVNVKILT